MKVEKLKAKARRHEQREEWGKAFDLYLSAISLQVEDEPPDITLFNRLGDLKTRLGHGPAAVEHYEKAIELYLDAELPNNAIAICKKVIRNLPDHDIFYLRMGQIRAAQGFLTDARQNFLAFAERSTVAGDTESALSALVEFVEISPEDVEIRLGLAAQLESHDRVPEAVEQYAEAYQYLVLSENETEAATVSVKLQELAPDQPLPDPEDLRANAAAVETGELILESTSLAGLGYDDPAEEPTTDHVGAETAFGVGSRSGDEPGEAPFEGVGEPEGAEDPLHLGADGGVPEPGVLTSLGFEEDEADTAEGEEIEGLPTFGFAEEAEGEGEEPLPTLSFEDELKDQGPLPSFQFDAEEAEEDEPLPTFDFEEEVEGVGEPLPTLEFEDEAEEVEPLPTIGFAEELEGVAATSLPTLDLGHDSDDAFEAEGDESEDLLESAVEGAFEEAAFEDREEAEAESEVAGFHDGEVPLQAGDHEAAAKDGDYDGAIEIIRSLIQEEPDDVDHHQRYVEYAFRKSDDTVLASAYMDLAGCLTRTGSPVKAKAVYQQVLTLAPGHSGALEKIQELEGVSGARPPAQVASSEEYVDLGSMILGEEVEKTTRWKVTADAPSGDEEADFAKMLGQFKEKVSENVAADDVAAHHDLGTAYMEMGLLDEAISEFQMALRASPDHLPTHEVMGRCWMEMGNSDMAVRALDRALQVNHEVEDDLIGIYYLMGRAQEDQGNTSNAMEFYEKVFSLDINFEDVTERLRALR